MKFGTQFSNAVRIVLSGANPSGHASFFTAEEHSTNSPPDGELELPGLAALDFLLGLVIQRVEPMDE